MLELLTLGMYQTCRYDAVGGPQGLLGHTSKTPPSIQHNTEIKRRIFRDINIID